MEQPNVRGCGEVITSSWFQLQASSCHKTSLPMRIIKVLWLLELSLAGQPHSHGGAVPDAQSWLDNKHTVFGRATGMDVVQ